MLSMSDPLQVAREAEQNLKTQASKTGAGKISSQDDAAVDSTAERKFPGAKVQYGHDLVTSASYNRKISESKGGDVDDLGRSTRGEQFEGEGPPEDDVARKVRDQGGENDRDVVGPPHKPSTQQAKSQFKGEDYYEQESVLDSIADQGHIPPDSIIHSSKDA